MISSTQTRKQCRIFCHPPPFPFPHSLPPSSCSDPLPTHSVATQACVWTSPSHRVGYFREQRDEQMQADDCEQEKSRQREHLSCQGQPCLSLLLFKFCQPARSTPRSNQQSTHAPAHTGHTWRNGHTAHVQRAVSGPMHACCVFARVHPQMHEASWQTMRSLAHTPSLSSLSVSCTHFGIRASAASFFLASSSM